MENVWGRGGVHIEFLWRKLTERGHLEHPDVDRRMILKWICRKGNGVA
jgi:hypothetical protein